MKLGFTGTREGMTKEQEITVYNLILDLWPEKVQHGDCKGADAQCEEAVRMLMGNLAKTIAHPCDIERWRAYCKASEVLPAKPPLSRNRDIVHASDQLIAAPKSKTFRAGGTWYTIGYAQKTGKHVTIVWPDGSVD